MTQLPGLVKHLYYCNNMKHYIISRKTATLKWGLSCYHYVKSNYSPVIRWLFVLNKIKFLQLASKYKNVFIKNI